MKFKSFYSAVYSSIEEKTTYFSDDRIFLLIHS